MTNSAATSNDGRHGYSVLCGTAGVQLQATAKEIESHLSKRFHGKVSYQNGEDPEDNTAASRVARPRREAIEKWNATLRNAVNSLDPSADYRFISCHLTLFHRARNVTFAPALIESFETDQFRPERIVVLIDDIFDVYGRLSSTKADTVFSEENAILRTEDRMINSVVRGHPELRRKLTERETALNLGITRISAIQQLVAWRRAEMQFAENLAAQRGIELHLVAVKHPMVTMDLLLKSGGEPAVAYVSHPITTQRWAFLDSEACEWPKYVERINELPGLLVDHDVVAISPTMIDEARFQPPTPDYIHLRKGAMLPRWPLGKRRRINDHSIAALHDEHGYEDRIFAHDPQVSSGYVKTLQTLLSDEVPYRDHYIIVHTPNFIAYQTRENGRPISAGVKHEIDHFAELANHEPSGSRRMVSVHDTCDVSAVVSLQMETGSSAWGFAWRRAIQYMRGVLSLNFDLVTEWSAEQILRVGRLEDSVLNSGIPELAARSYREKSLKVFALTYLYLELCGLDKVRPWCLLVVDNLCENRHLSAVSDWLHSRSNMRTPWPDKDYDVPILLPDDLKEIFNSDGFDGWPELRERLSRVTHLENVGTEEEV